MKLTDRTFLCNVLAIVLVRADSSEEGGTVDIQEISYEVKESHTYNVECEETEEKECRNRYSTVKKFNIFPEDELKELKECKDCKNALQGGSYYEALTKEESKWAKMSNDELQVDKEEYVWPHQEYKKERGCGYPICVLIDAKPVRFKSLCRFMRHIKKESLTHRMFHFQKGDCITAIGGKGLNYEWGKKSSCGHLEDKFDIPLCLVDLDSKSAFHFDNPCKAMEYMSYRKEAITMYVGTGDRGHRDQCKEMLKNKRTYLKTEWFDIDDPCTIGDLESATQVYNYVKTYELTSSFRFCAPRNQKESFKITTVHGQSLQDAQNEGQRTRSSMNNGGEFVCLNSENKKAQPPDYWFTKTIKCKDYRIQFKCKCFFGCKLREKTFEHHSYTVEGWHVRVPDLPNTKTLFEECHWRPYVSIDASPVWDAETRHKMLWPRKKGADDKAGDFGLYQGHACGPGFYDAMYVDTRRIKDSRPASETGEKITKNTPHFGFLCFDKNQDGDTTCSNYKIRFCCSKQKHAMWGSWSEWTKCSITCGKGGYMTRKRVCKDDSSSGTCAGVEPSMEENKEGHKIQVDKVHDCMHLPCDPQNYADWSSWSNWLQCSVSCGEGTQIKTRKCTHKCKNKIKIMGEWKCTGPNPCPSKRKSRAMFENTQSCPGVPCSDPVWGAWGEWSRCEKTCGKKITFQQKTRICVDSRTYDEIDIQECLDDGGEGEEFRPCGNPPPCPVDWTWEKWGAWGPCSILCGKGGNQERTRFCKGPTFDGKKCPKKSDDETRPCGTDNKCPESCVWTQWGEWSTCSKTCYDWHGNGKLIKGTDEGTQERRRRIERDGRYGGKKCNPCQTVHKQGCNAKERCIKPCVWGKWGEWDDECSSCFPDKHEKDYCENEEPQKLERTRKKLFKGTLGHCKDVNGKTTTRKTDREEKDCGCDMVICKRKDCIWAQWSEWGDCEGKCGVRGKMKSTRKCLYLEDDSDPHNAEEVDCDYDEKCRLMVKFAEDPANGITNAGYRYRDCPDLCTQLGWTEWSEWGICSKTCGKGEKIRNRRCNGAGKDEIDSKESPARKIAKCISDDGKDRLREKQKTDCDMGSCSKEIDCPYHDDPCKKLSGYRRFRRQNRRRNRRQRV